MTVIPQKTKGEGKVKRGAKAEEEDEEKTVVQKENVVPGPLPQTTDFASFSPKGNASSETTANSNMKSLPPLQSDQTANPNQKDKI